MMFSFDDDKNMRLWKRDMIFFSNTRIKKIVNFRVIKLRNYFIKNATF